MFKIEITEESYGLASGGEYYVNLSSSEELIRVGPYRSITPIEIYLEPVHRWEYLFRQAGYHKAVRFIHDELCGPHRESACVEIWCAARNGFPNSSAFSDIEQILISAGLERIVENCRIAHKML